jgi:penicillin-binding protein 2
MENFSPYSYQPQLIQENLPYQKALLLEVEAAKLPGVVLEISSRREYLGGEELSHLLGYTGKISPEELKEKPEYFLFNDYIGKAGLEASYENILKGQDGKKQIEIDSLGREKKVIKSWPSQSGLDLILSIDLDLQKKAALALKNGLKQAGSKKGAIIALDPRNGEVLAMVSLPGFDNNKFSQGMGEEEYKKLVNNPNQPLFLRAISGQYPSGSTIKLLIATAALEEGIIISQTVINSTGGIKIGKWFFHDWKAGGHGLTRVNKAIAESVNTFFYYIGGGYEDFQGLGLEEINKYLRLFGLSKILGIDLPNEKPGFLPSREWKEKEKGEPWYIGDTYHLVIGQGDILVTPLQVASWTATVANGGILYQPHLTINKKQLTISDQEYIIRKNFISPSNLDIVRKGMREAVISGSARGLSDLTIKVASKTGTAQTGGDKKPHAWFTCFAPYDNPQIVITVLVENGGEGSGAALKVAREVLISL